MNLVIQDATARLGATTTEETVRNTISKKRLAPNDLRRK
jgi:hypothetical protein